MTDVQKAKDNLQKEIKENEEKLNQFRDDRYQKEKNKFLIRLGLYEKKYMQEGDDPEDYPETEHSDDSLEDSGKGMEQIRVIRYRNQPYSVSDEEYEELKKLHQQKKAVENQIKKEVSPSNQNKIEPMNNTIGLYLRRAANILLILYILLGLVFVAEESGFSLMVGITVISTGVLTALLYYGFSEVIRLLQQGVNQKE
ncbi:MAG: hypothetical protein ACOCSM_00660 [Bacillota bacterium]